MATYYVWSGATGLANGSSWTDAYTSLDALLVGQAIAGGDVILIASDHNNVSYAASKTFTFPESGQSTASHVYLISTDRASGLPAVGAIEQTGGNFSLTIHGKLNIYGVTFITGSGGSEASADLSLSVNSSTKYGKKIFTKCKFRINSTASGAVFSIGSSTYASEDFDFIECEFQFGTTLHNIQLDSAIANFVNCSLVGPTYPSSVFMCTDSSQAYLVGCDFSGSTNLIVPYGSYNLVVLAKNSILPASVFSSPISRTGQMNIEFHSCTSTDHTYFYKKAVNEGVVEHSVNVYLTSGGATTKDSDGSNVNYSLKLTGATDTYNCSKNNPLYTPWLYVPVFSTGSKTFSIKVAHEQASVLKDNEVWMEVEYMGGTATVNTPQTVREITAPLITGTVFQDYRAVGSNLTDTVEAWTGLATEKTHTLSKTVTVDEQGYARVRVALAVNNISIYVNPDVAVV